MSIYVHAKLRAEFVLEIGDGTNGPVQHEEPHPAIIVAACTALDPPLSVEEVNPSVDLLVRSPRFLNFLFYLPLAGA
jgi:hypothetical protein